MNKFLLTVCISFTSMALFSQGQVVWKDLEGNLLPDEVELNRLPQHEQVVFEALISNISANDYNVLLKRTIISYTSGSTDQLCYGISCQNGDENKAEIVTNASLQAAGTNVNTVDPFEMIHFAPAEIAGTTSLKYYIITETDGVQTLQDSVIVNYVIAPYKRVDLRFTVDMTGATDFNPDLHNVYVQVFDQGTGMTIKKMKKPTTGLVYTLGSTGHYYVDNDLSYIQKYFYGTYNSETSVYDTVGEPTVRPLFAVQQEDEIPFADVWGVTVGVKQEAASTVTIFPNPFQNNLTLENLDGNSTVEITNILGQTVYSTKTLKNRLVLSTGDLKSGIYFVRVVDAKNHIQVERMIKR